MVENKIDEIKESVFDILNKVDVSSKIDEKIGLKYLSWANAWTYLRGLYPEATWQVYSRVVQTSVTKVIPDELTKGSTTITTDYQDEIPYFTDGKTCYVKVGVTIEGREEIEMLPIMDNKNNAVPLASVTMTLVNKAIQRAFVKACARHGLGLYVYAGEDLPEGVKKPTIDFNALMYEVQNMQLEQVNEEDFKKLQNFAIEKITNMNYEKDVTDKVIAAIGSFSSKRISQLVFNVAEDNIAIQKIANYINKLEALLIK